MAILISSEVDEIQEMDSSMSVSLPIVVRVSEMFFFRDVCGAN